MRERSGSSMSAMQRLARSRPAPGRHRQRRRGAGHASGTCGPRERRAPVARARWRHRPRRRLRERPDMPLSDEALAPTTAAWRAYGITAGKLKVAGTRTATAERLASCAMRSTGRSPAAAPNLMIDANEFWTPEAGHPADRGVERQFDLRGRRSRSGATTIAGSPRLARRAHRRRHGARIRPPSANSFPSSSTSPRTHPGPPCRRPGSRPRCASPRWLTRSASRSPSSTARDGTLPTSGPCSRTI